MFNKSYYILICPVLGGLRFNKQKTDQHDPLGIYYHYPEDFASEYGLPEMGLRIMSMRLNKDYFERLL